MAYVILGLGNPGAEYAKTRHNAGRMVVELFAKKEGFDDFAFRKTAQASVSEGVIETAKGSGKRGSKKEGKGEKVVLVLPEVSMNLSGKAATPFVKSVKAAKNLLVIRDDLDLPLGSIKMTTYGRGSGGHKGVESIMRALKTKEFVQMKIGISASTPKGKLKKPGSEEKVITHVIGKFSPKEEEVLKKTLARAAMAARAFVALGLEKALQEANTR
jgi:PTH1 family peptidyl-tRNA hydrolase